MYKDPCYIYVYCIILCESANECSQQQIYIRYSLYKFNYPRYNPENTGLQTYSAAEPLAGRFQISLNSILANICLDLLYVGIT